MHHADSANPPSAPHDLRRFLAGNLAGAADSASATYCGNPIGPPVALLRTTRSFTKETGDDRIRTNQSNVLRRIVSKIKKTDAHIRQDVLNELKWDTRVEPTSIGIQVDNGVVTLTGTVSSWAKKMSVEEAAHRVAGVLDVANDVTVKVAGGARTDAELAAAVRHALQWDVFVPDDLIQSTVDNGMVTLKGVVDTYAQRDDAYRAVRNLTGVRSVENQLAVLQGQVTPSELRSAIHDALERHADREAAKIQIDVEGGRVTLRGNVHSWRDREAVIGAVTGTRGVDRVVDRLRIA